jgi:hypothetical protein
MAVLKGLVTDTGPFGPNSPSMPRRTRLMPRSMLTGMKGAVWRPQERAVDLVERALRAGPHTPLDGVLRLPDRRDHLGVNEWQEGLCVVS